MDERSADFAKSLPITVGKLKTNVYDFLQNSRYRRKFISAGVGDYLGDFKAPGVASGLWSYTDYQTGVVYRDWETDRKSTRLNSSHITRSRMPSSA